MEKERFQAVSTYIAHKVASKRTTGNLIAILASTIILIMNLSCEKVIQLNLNREEVRIVIQGNVYDQPGPFQVKISSSVNFDTASVYPPVRQAKVVISDDAGQSETLTESIAGTYNTAKFRGIPGRSYTLSVTAGNKVYQSISRMPAAVPIDSIYFANSLFSGKMLTGIVFRDPPGQSNYYRLVYFINNIRQTPFYVMSDELFQGQPIHYALTSRGGDINLKKGDTVTIWLESIDKDVYEFYRTTRSDGGQSASPSNPVSNISNNALGYFNACSVRKISATVPK